MRALRIDEIREATGGELLCGREEEKISYISIDSRDVKEGTLFVPLVGEKVDAHRFLEPVIAAGAKAVFTAEALTEAQREAAAKTGTAVIRVPDTLRALQALAGWVRSRLSLPLIGVTGSVGKTTTREMIAAALSAKYRVFKTKANHNSQIGVPLTLLDIEDEEIGVIEMAVSRRARCTSSANSCVRRRPSSPTSEPPISWNSEAGKNIRDEKLKIQDGMQKMHCCFGIRTMRCCSRVRFGTELRRAPTASRKARTAARRMSAWSTAVPNLRLTFAASASP